MEENRGKHIKNPAAVLLGKISAEKRKARSSDWKKEMRDLRQRGIKKKSTGM